MPSVQAGTSRNGAAVIELSIPMRLVNRRARGGAASAGRDSDEEDDEVTCYICANSFCDEEECQRAMTHLGCCTQAICCGCLVKSSKRCTCKEDCDAVISLCPFCREVSAVEALDVFLGHKPPCKACVRADERAAARSRPAPPPTATTEVIDLTQSSDDEDGAPLPALQAVV